MNFVRPSPTQSVLTCLLRSSVIRWIWIFFLPMFPLLQWEGQKRGRGHVRRWSTKDFSPLWNVWVTVMRPPRARWAGSQSHGGRRRRGRTGLGERHLPQIMVPSVGVRSSTIQAQLGSCVLPFTSAQQLLKNRRETFMFICSPWPTLATTNIVFAFAPDIQACNQASQAPSNHTLKREAIFEVCICVCACWGPVMFHAEQETLRGPRWGRLCCVSFIRGIIATSLICWSPTATGCQAVAARHGECDSPISNMEQRGVAEHIETAYFPFSNAVLHQCQRGTCCTPTTGDTRWHRWWIQDVRGQFSNTLNQEAVPHSLWPG